MAIYRNQVRRAAIGILKYIIQPTKWGKSKIYHYGGTVEKMPEIIYVYHKLQTIKSFIGFEDDILLAASLLLESNNHITILKNETDEYDISLLACKNGEIALREGIYQDDIIKYNNDKFYSYVRWVLPVIAIVISIISLIISIRKH